MKRPLPVLLFGCLFIFAGAVGLGYHLAKRPLEPNYLLISGIRLLAILGGVFLLFGKNWARWLLLGWLGFHVIVSFYHSVSEIAVHAALLLVFVYFIFRPTASRFFRSRT